MNFKDKAVILSKKLLQENSYIICAFTEKHGIYSGVTRASKKSLIDLTEGNIVDFLWNARLDDHLGYVKIEFINSFIGYLLQDRIKLYAFNSMVALLKLAFFEREPHNQLFPYIVSFMHSLKQDFCFKEYIKLELAILSEAGYKLQLDECAATGSTDDLFYVSPKSGRAISKKMGEQFADKMLILPSFLIDGGQVTNVQIQQSYQLCSYFIERYILLGRPLPKEREEFFRCCKV